MVIDVEVSAWCQMCVNTLPVISLTIADEAGVVPTGG